jgi:isopenicillin N synthase-like dioxygenase
MAMTGTDRLPVVDVSPLIADARGQGLPADRKDAEGVGRAIHGACVTHGFFYVTGHGVPSALQDRLERLSHRFFAQDLDTKMKIRMSLGGRAWRGYFPVGDELTSGRPDLKEGLYFGAELPPDDPRVQAGVPLHGPNLFPADMPELRDTVLAYMDQLTKLGHAVMGGVALSLGLDASYFRMRYMADPLILFRIFHYPSTVSNPRDEAVWGVGEHTDYGVLTLLKQDDVGGLQVRSKTGWIDAPPVSGAFVCNIGDMLDRLTGGLYRSTPHRVRNVSGRGRVSFPFFFDPGFDARIEPIELPADLAVESRPDVSRWDGADLKRIEGTYGEYVLSKVAKVFPDLRRSVL